MLAQLCGVTLPTIHTWAERKLVPGFRTPGRQLRFKPREVAVWMRARGYDVPEGLEEVGAAE
jgi:excisionase family DNA binding protein